MNLGTSNGEHVGKGDFQWIDAMAAQAATLLVESLSTARNQERQQIWDAFIDLVVERLKQRDEALVHEALDALQVRGIRPEVVARSVSQRLSQMDRRD